jgi:hypothetical protein
VPTAIPTAAPTLLPPYITTKQGTLSITDAVGVVLIGRIVALSSNGNTLATGGYADNSSIGATWIFIRPGTTWSQEAKLVGLGYTGANATQGRSVALSADGNTLVVGGSIDNSGIGATWVFTRTGGIWTQEGDKLVGTGNTGSGNQGNSVALSADGNTLATAAHLDNSGKGAIWIFTKINGTWTQQGSKLVGTGNIGNANLGFGIHSLALSSDGNTLAVGGYTDNTNIGAVWIFIRSGDTWTQQGSKLVGTGRIGTSRQGYCVSISSDGNTLAFGGYTDNTNMGAVWIFIRSGVTWTQQGTKLVPTGGVGGAQHGRDVALSADGNYLAEGAWFESSNACGGVYMYSRSGTTWTQQGPKRVASPCNTNVGQGTAVALSADGYTMASGTPFDTPPAVYTFV